MTTANARANAARDSRRFWLMLVLIALAGLAWRVIYITRIGREYATYGDPYFYHQQAIFLAEGHGFADPSQWRATGRYVATSFHPPLYPMALSVSSFLGFSSYFAHRITSCIIGAGVVIVVGLVGRRVAGVAAGLIAALLAAAYPNLWMIDGILFPEGLFAFTIGLTILAAYRVRSHPNYLSASLLGGAIALGALTRGEAILLVAFLTIPIILLMRNLDWGKRLRLLLVAFLATGAVMAPWTYRNLTTFNEPVLVSSNGDAVLAFANCDQVYSGPFIGFWYHLCPKSHPTGDESEVALGYRRMGLRYIRSNLDRVPAVVAARVGRIWGVYRPIQSVTFSTGEGRPLWAAKSGLFVYWALVPPAVLGAWLMFRRRVTLIPLVAQIVLVTFTAATVYATTRFALPGDFAVIVLAAVGIDGIVVRLRRGSFFPPESESPLGSSPEDPAPEPAPGQPSPASV